MLASITPLGERGRHATWSLTVTTFVLGSLTAAAVAGALLGVLGGAVLPRSAGPHARLAALAAAGLAALFLDLRRGRVPGPRRQVDERWLSSYRGWVYGVGYGTQLGLGVTTVVTSAAIYFAWFAALLAGTAAGGAFVLGCFGAVRGLSLLAAARVRRPDQLLALHERMGSWRIAVLRCGSGLMAVVVAAAIIGSAA